MNGASACLIHGSDVVSLLGVHVLVIGCYCIRAVDFVQNLGGGECKLFGCGFEYQTIHTLNTIENEYRMWGGVLRGIATS